MNRAPFTRAILILLTGILLALLAGGAAYWTLTAPHRVMLRQHHPELAWLQREFNLSPAEFERISDLHRAYLPHCAELCERIAALHDNIRNLVQQSSELTPEIMAHLEEAARVRVECQQMMLDHFFAVSRAMSPEQGRRYLTWVQEKTFHMDHERTALPGTKSGHGPADHQQHQHH
jgi:hypothetical protein